jgi:hypothetical protein
MTTKKMITLLALLGIILALCFSEIIWHIKNDNKPVEEDISSAAAPADQNPDELEIDLSIEEENEDVSIDK